MGRNKNKGKLIAIALIISLLLGCVHMPFMPAQDKVATAETEDEIKSMTAQEITQAMGKGWNLGNTMESCGSWINGSTAADYETKWGQPVTTNEILAGVKAAGFGSVRIPVAWSNLLSDDGKYTIHESYFNRVDEIVGYVLENDMYAIINIHYDSGWWGLLADDDEEVRVEAMNRYKTMWSQIADHYKDYSYKLIFESANEELGDFKYYDPKADKETYTKFSDSEKYKKVNEINQEFVNVVRGSGGKNAERFLLIAGYNTDIDKTCDSRYVMPNDTIEKHLMVSVHYYTPSTYCIADKEDNSWGYMASWGTDSDKKEMRRYFEKMKKFTDAGYGVIIGEYGVAEISKGGVTMLKEGADVFAETALSLAAELGYCAMLWDCSNWYDRKNLKFKYDNLVSVFEKDYSSGDPSVEIPNPESPAPPAGDTTPTAAPAQPAAPTASAISAQEQAVRDMTAIQLTEKMGNGWNLGNTMEATGSWINGSTPTDYETAWGQPVTTKEMIAGVKAAGFDSVRIPVAWSNMLSEDGKYTINAEYFKRVDEIIGYVLENDMYAVVNIHWDSGWWGLLADDDEAVRNEAMNRYKTMWSQIAAHYKDYSYKLIFESANEELGDFKYYDQKTSKETYTNFSDDDKYKKVNEVNQEFVNLVRGSGGKNADRFLLIAGYNTDIDKTCDDRYVMPKDTVANHLIVSVHYYTPSTYCISDNEDNSWGYMASWGDKWDRQGMKNNLKKMTKFTDAGYGVIIGEYGVAEIKDYDQRMLKEGADIFCASMIKYSEEYGYCPMLWDCNNFYDRNACLLRYDNLAPVFNREGETTETVKSSGLEKNGIYYRITSYAHKEVTVTGFTKKARTSIKIPNKVKIDGKKYKVTEIKEKAFANQKKLKKVKIGSSVKKIGRKAFYNCKNLKSCQYNKKAKIGKKAFAKCAFTKKK